MKQFGTSSTSGIKTSIEKKNYNFEKEQFEYFKDLSKEEQKKISRLKQLFDIDKLIFVGGLATQTDKKDGNLSVIKKNGDIYPKLGYEELGIYSEGLACMRKIDGDTGWIDTQQKEVMVSNKYDTTGNFSHGYAMVTKSYGNERIVGFVDKKGKEYIMGEYSSVDEFRKGFSLVMEKREGQSTRLGWIDTDFNYYDSKYIEEGISTYVIKYKELYGRFLPIFKDTLVEKDRPINLYSLALHTQSSLKSMQKEFSYIGGITKEEFKTLFLSNLVETNPTLSQREILKILTTLED